MRFSQVPVFIGGVRTADRIISLPVFRVPGIRRLRDSNSCYAASGIAITMPTAGLCRVGDVLSCFYCIFLPFSIVYAA